MTYAREMKHAVASMTQNLEAQAARPASLRTSRSSPSTKIARKRWPTPTTLIVIDEADRLSITSLEQVRSIFDQGGLGLILVGMPGIEMKMARIPQLYSRIGFVHEFRPLAAAEVQKLLETG